MSIPKKWNIDEMRIRVNNLKKILPEPIINCYYNNAKILTDNELDALYITYYGLKDFYLRYNRSTFGKVNHVDYEPRQIKNAGMYNIYYNDYIIKAPYMFTTNVNFDYSSMYPSMYTTNGIYTTTANHL